MPGLNQCKELFHIREITKNISIPVDGKPLDFRLTKLDAFSGASLLRMLASMPSNVIPSEAEGSPDQQPPALSLLRSLSEPDLRSLMTTCLQHCEVLLPAGWMPVMTRGEWTYPELEHDTAVCLKLTIEEVLWTLEGFFGGGDLRPPPVAEEGRQIVGASRPEIPGSQR